MALLKHAKQGIEILKLNKKALSSAARDKKALGSAIFFLVTSTLVIILTDAYSSKINENMLLKLAFATVASVAAYYAAVFLLTKLMGHKKGYGAYFRASGLASIIGYATMPGIVLPVGITTIIALLISAWNLAVEYFIIKNVYKIQAWKAVLIIAIATIVFFVPYFVVYAR